MFVRSQTAIDSWDIYLPIRLVFIRFQMLRGSTGTDAVIFCFRNAVLNLGLAVRSSQHHERAFFVDSFFVVCTLHAEMLMKICLTVRTFFSINKR